jgi:hypothetical protein
LLAFTRRWLVQALLADRCIAAPAVAEVPGGRSSESDELIDSYLPIGIKGSAFSTSRQCLTITALDGLGHDESSAIRAISKFPYQAEGCFSEVLYLRIS